MDPLIILFWVICGVVIIVSLRKEKEKTKNAAHQARKMIGNLLGKIVAILLLIGLLLTLIPTDTIHSLLGGGSSEIISTTIAAITGSITLIPAFMAFPLVGSFLKMGIGITTAVAFLTTLTMVGVVTFPLEKQEFGWRFTLVRNGLSFLFAIIISGIMGVILL